VVRDGVTNIGFEAGAAMYIEMALRTLVKNINKYY